MKSTGCLTSVDTTSGSVSLSRETPTKALFADSVERVKSRTTIQTRRGHGRGGA